MKFRPVETGRGKEEGVKRNIAKVKNSKKLQN